MATDVFKELLLGLENHDFMKHSEIDVIFQLLCILEKSTKDGKMRRMLLTPALK
jgi:hypothetical protein